MARGSAHDGFAFLCLIALQHEHKISIQNSNPSPNVKIIVLHHVLKMLLEHFTLVDDKNTIKLRHIIKYVSAGNDRRNTVDLSWRQKIEIDSACLTRDGKEFQAPAVGTGNARSPSDERRVKGTRSIRASADRRSRCPSTSAAR
jgi:hypothetical protein